MRLSLRPSRDRFGLVALALYLALSLIILGRGLARDPNAFFVGFTADPSVYMWFLVWWPRALAHWINPFITGVLWAPIGFNLTWTTGIPLAGLVAAPITARFGPIISYNLLCLLCPALAAWTGFLLCRRIAKLYWPSIIGGYLFGFSAYMLAEIRGHLLLTLIFPVPLAVMLVLRRLDNEIRAASFVLLMALTLAASSMFSLEMFATMTFFGAIALALTAFLGTADTRRRIYSLAPQLALSYLLVLVLISPYLYFFFQPGFPRSPVNSPAGYSADLLNFIIPTPSNALGTLGILPSISHRFAGAMVETAACFGLPLLAIALMFFRANWTETRSRLLAWFIAIVILASLGPRLHVAGVTLFGLPWKLFQHLPLINNALPGRFPMYGFLALAIVAALWLASDSGSRLTKLIGVAALAIFLFPNPSARFWISPIDLPPFFADGSYRQYLHPDETVVILPYGAGGPCMLWQAESGMYFRMAGGWTSIMPREFQNWPAVNALLYRSYIPGFLDQLRAFLAHHDTNTLIVADRERPLWEPMLAPLRLSPIETGGVAIYHLTPADLSPWREVTALEMERRSAAARFDALLVAAQKYLATGGKPDQLSPRRVESLGLLLAHSTNEAGIRTSNGLYLGPLDNVGPGVHENELIGVGVVGSIEALRPIIAKYRSDAVRIYFPYPRALTEPPHGDTFMRQLVIAFDRDGLARAAAKSSP